MNERALVCFHEGQGQHWAARFLKPGYRHVWVVVLDPSVGWIMVDPRLGTPHIAGVCNPNFDLATHYRDQGIVVVEAAIRDIEPIGPLMIANCVSVVKKVIGRRWPFCWTPWQLCRRLQRESESA